MGGESEFVGRARGAIFSVGIGAIAWGLIWRDRVLGRIDPAWAAAAASVESHWISSGGNRLDARLVRPVGSLARANVLICHGIGETVEHWLGVQVVLSELGVASLVFNYSGYGRSTGRIGVEACERDAVAAFEFFSARLGGEAVALLGYSLGSGIAAAIAGQVGAHRMVLCAAFTTLRKGACSAGLPRALAWLLPDVWRTEEMLRDCTVRVLIVQGEKDRLFPPWMAWELGAAGGAGCEVIVVPGLSHNGPMSKPTVAYWAVVVEGIVGRSAAVDRDSRGRLPDV